jgi:hypothetical protein
VLDSGQVGVDVGVGVGCGGGRFAESCECKGQLRLFFNLFFFKKKSGAWSTQTLLR